MDDALRERVEALERAVTDGDHDLSAFADEAAALDRIDTLESQVEEVEERVEELEAATQALRGYVGNVRSVNADVEQRADTALAKAESLESAVMESGAADATNTANGERTTGGSSVEQSDSGTGGTGMTIDLGTGDTDRESDDIDRTSGRTDRASDARGRDPAGQQSGGTDPGAGGTDDPVAGGHGRDGGQWEPEVQTPRGRSGDSGPARADDRRCRECGRPHTAGDGPGGSENAGSIGPESDAVPGEGVVPDGETDPFVGTAGGNGTDEAGTLQRIRDLL